jgi:hypothetical protein
VTADRFYTLIEECLGGGCCPGELAVDEARRTAHVVLQTIGSRLSRAERFHLAAALPRLVAVDLMAVPEHDIPDAVAHVACELDVDAEVARRRIHCVVATLEEAAGGMSIDAAGVSDLS